ncbi:Paraslipin domain protein [Candidatus Cyrtobacter comes]|uniref:Paraslipin domain protein n=1 Tax=Candidatus Cyrtobacter comes TaxID=675776 RepID=A0ABU5L707_9RICK|nr:stomatin-like protein [Candidatus Cyrtobacter comes]MDZ5761675.1 Paraslipin domain protein [Candidatus Cyrtobacter comes]
MEIVLFILIAFVVIIFSSLKIVPQQQSWIVERLGRYHKTLQPGVNIILPFMDSVKYKHTLKETVLDVMEQAAITKDNVSVLLDGVLYVRIINPVDASYGIENPYYAVTQLAQTSMRSAIGKLSMDTTFEERDFLNTQIVNAINEAATTWGIQCMRYELKDIKPPATVVKAMETQVAAERQKRAEILNSEGKMQSMINIAEAKKREVVLASEAVMAEKANIAKGEGEAIQTVAVATAIGIERIASVIGQSGGQDAVSFKIAQEYVSAFKQIAQKGNTIVVPANVSDASSLIAQALGVFRSINTAPKEKK